jgi:hypothetical protein
MTHRDIAQVERLLEDLVESPSDVFYVLAILRVITTQSGGRALFGGTKEVLDDAMRKIEELP